MPKRSFAQLDKPTMPSIDDLKESSRQRPEFYIENALCKIKPYFFNHFSHAKRRWVGLSLGEVCKKEFMEYPNEYYRLAIERGMLRINGKIVSEDVKIKDNDLLSHLVHKHEPPIIDLPINTLFEDENMLVVNKPGSVPVHPSGRYFYNTLVEKLKHHSGYSFLSTINRLDRVTSGVVILAKNPASANALSKCMRDRLVEKEYVAKVDGHFPSEGTIECSEPVGIIDHKMSIHGVYESPSQEVPAVTDNSTNTDSIGHASNATNSLLMNEKFMEIGHGKPAKTIFKLVSYDPITNTSIVNCRPITGRSHQIRVHLQYIGFPISNDTLYNNKLWRDPAVLCLPTQYERSKKVASMIKNLLTPAVDAIFNPKIHNMLRNLLVESEENLVMHEVKNSTDDSSIICYKCSGASVDPDPSALYIYLHAYKYRLIDTNQTFIANLPDWTK